MAKGQRTFSRLKGKTIARIELIHQDFEYLVPKSHRVAGEPETGMVYDIATHLVIVFTDETRLQVVADGEEDLEHERWLTCNVLADRRSSKTARKAAAKKKKR